MQQALFPKRRHARMNYSPPRRLVRQVRSPFSFICPDIRNEPDNPLTDSSVVKVTVGLQLGGQALNEMVFFQDKRAYDEFTSGSFEFDANASAVAITVGAQAQAGTKGATAGASAGPATAEQAKTTY